jgi:glycosyltransferase involved in cell wall biosynthesis
MIYVGSLKYSPVYKSHCCAFGESCEEEGYTVRYLFSREYEWMLSEKIKENTIFIGSSTNIPEMLYDTVNARNIRTIKKNFSKDRPTHVYMHNYHLLNHYIAKLCRKQGCAFLYHVHEPYVENKSAHGGLQQYWLYLNEFMEEKLLRDTSVAVVSSKEASRLFDMRYPWFKGKKVEIPLMYEDLGKELKPVEERKYVTFVGPLVPAKSPELFLKIIDYSAEHDLSYSFLLISRSQVNDQSSCQKSNLTIFHKSRISDEEYGELISKSLVVLTPYKRETQSSVILVSYMYGTPVVSSNVGGLPEFVSHRRTGYLVDMNAPVEEWIKGIDYVIENLHELSVNCRGYFVDSFSAKNWKKYLKTILI